MKTSLTASPAICLAACLVGASPALAAAPGPEPINLAQVNLDLDQLNPLSVADSFYQQAADLYEAGDYEQALTYLNVPSLFELPIRRKKLPEVTVGQNFVIHPPQQAESESLASLTEAETLLLQVMDFYSVGQYAEAIPLAEQILAMVEGQLGPNHAHVATSLSWLAMLYQAMGRYREAKPLYERALAINEAHLGPDHPDVGTSLNNLAELYRNIGRYREAKPLYERALAIDEAQLGPDHPHVAISLNNLALLYSEIGRYGEAEFLLERSLAIREQQLGPSHPDVAQSLNSLGGLYQMIGRYGEAVSLLERALAVRESQLGPDHPSVALSLNNLAVLYQDMGRYEEAEPMHKRALAIRERQLAANHPSVANSLNNLAELYREMGRYEEAESLYERALAILERQLGPDHPDVATNLNNLALLFQTIGRYREAEPLHEHALAIQKQQLGLDHPGVAASMNNLALLYRTMGRYEEAETLYESSLRIVEAQLGPNHSNVAASLNNLSLLYQAMSRYSEAEPLIERALVIQKQQLGLDHPDVATSMNNLAELNRMMGRYEEAESLYESSLRIVEAQLGPDHPDVAANLNNLALLYRAMGRYSEAEPLIERALTIQEQQLGPDHPSVATKLNNLALLYRTMGRYSEAEPLHERALAIREQQLGTDHPDVSQSLNNLAVLYWDIGRYGEAEPLYERAIAIREAQLGPDHHDMAQSLNNLAGLHHSMGRYDKAASLFNRAADIEEANLARLLTIGSEPQKQAYMATLSGTTHGTHTLALQTASPQAPHLGLTTLLRRKGRILDAVADSLRIVRQQLGDDPQAQAQLDELIAVRSQLAALATHGQGQLDPEQYRQRYESLVQQERTLESRLNRLSSAFQAVDDPVTITAVQAQLPDDAALVEFVRYRPYDLKADRDQHWGEDRYAAYILKPTGDPQVVDLGTAEVIVPLVRDFRLALQNPSEVATKTVHPTGRALYAQILQPLAEVLGEVDHLLLSPDGALNLIPFEALVTHQERYLIEDYRLSYLTSGRDLVRLDALPNSQNPSLIVANPDYNEADTQIAATPATTRGQQNRRSADLATLSFGALPGTETEVTELETLFQETALPVDVLTGRQATETQVKQAQAPSILHIATHGFFLPDQEVELTPEPGLGTLGDTPPPVLNIENPLIRSGLALAAANPPRPDLDANEDDGLLTALELAGMNLYGTQLVVLSACETGVGGNSSGEGIYGLRRALVMAGVQSQVVSLWHVADQRTANLMVDYYQRLLDTENPVGRHEALRDAQLAMLRSEDETSHPYYWAAFIASGDWRPLEF